MQKKMFYLIYAFAMAIVLRISAGLYFNDEKIDSVLNQLSWTTVILFLIGVVSIRGYYLYLDKKNVK